MKPKSHKRKKDAIEDFVRVAKRIRKSILRIIYNGKAPHIGPSFSLVEILVALYYKCMNVSPSNCQDPSRDRFILSKGHGCPALYAVLADRGFLPPHDIKTFGHDGGVLEEHPMYDLNKGIEASTGSLGHGLSLAAGMALSSKYDNISNKIFTIVGCGETNAGFIWEAALFAAQHKLDNLIVIVDYNKIQALGNNDTIIDLEPYSDKWCSFGWSVREVNGHNFSELFSAFEDVPFEKGKPNVIIAHTVKGKGVSFMENSLLWHYRCPNKQEYVRAVKELS
ncbi:MAG: transketolase [Candidatus Omnitrophica bacterium]|nr:transketolase [Candidatus Omnitrophota bacterium]